MFREGLASWDQIQPKNEKVKILIFKNFFQLFLDLEFRPPPALRILLMIWVDQVPARVRGNEGKACREQPGTTQILQPRYFRKLNKTFSELFPGCSSSFHTFPYIFCQYECPGGYRYYKNDENFTDPKNDENFKK